MDSGYLHVIEIALLSYAVYLLSRILYFVRLSYGETEDIRKKTQ